MQTKVERKPRSEAVVTGVLPADEIRLQFPKSLDRAVREVALPGFRKGKVPKERVLQEVGEKSLWRDAAEDVLRGQLSDILKEHSLVPILPPSVSLTVSAHESDVPFTVTVTTQPTLTIDNYKSVAEGALKKLERLNGEKEKTEARKSLDAQIKAMLQKTDLPTQAGDSPTTDDEAKKVGFENALALEHFLNTEADRAVENYDSQRKRGAVAEALLINAKYDIAPAIVMGEARAMLESTKAEIAKQMPFNQYLEKRGMTEDAVRDEMMPAAEKRVALDIVFAKIAGEEKLEPDNEEVPQVAHALMGQGVPAERAHAYAAEVSVREKIWSLLGVAAPAKQPEPAHEHKH